MSTKSELFGFLISEARHCCMREPDATEWGNMFLKDLAEHIRDEFPDPNPLASLFSDYIGDEIADYIENLGR